MALDNQFGKGIGLAAGFDLGAQKPLDARVAVNTIAERDAHIENNRAYEGMLVYVAEANMTYQLVKGEEEGQLVWKEFGFNQNDFDESFNGAIQDVDDRLKAVEEDLAQGGEIEARIAQNEADIDGLQGLVGQPAQAGEGEEEVPATGLHLALDNAKVELDQAILDEKGRAEGQEAAIRQELADEAAEIRGEMAAELGNYTVEAAEGVEAKEASGLRKEIEDAHAAIRQEALQAKNAMEQALAQAVAGEKERGTISTMLMAPISKNQIVLGKILSAIIITVIASVCSFVGLMASLNNFSAALGEAGSLSLNLDFVTGCKLLVMVLLISLIAVSLFLVASTFAKSTKEATMYAMPVYILGIVSGVFTMYDMSMPTELYSYIIPIYNLTLGLKGIFINNLSALNFSLIVGSNIIYFMIILLIVKKMFNSEKIMLSR